MKKELVLGLCLLVVMAGLVAFGRFIRKPAGKARENPPAEDQFLLLDGETERSWEEEEGDSPPGSVAEDPILDKIADGIGEVQLDLGPGFAEEWIEFDRLSGDMLYPDVPMQMESAIWRAYQSMATNPAIDLAEMTARLLSSSSAYVRVTGLILLLEKEGHLDSEIQDRLVADEEVLVPLTALGWMLDAGLQQDAVQFEAKWKDGIPESWNVALQALYEQPLNSMAGRASLWMSERSDRSPEEKRALVAGVALDEDTAYDIRWKAVMLLRNRMGFAEYQVIVAQLQGGRTPPVFPLQERAEGDAPPRLEPITPLSVAMGLLNERISGPEQVMGRRTVLAANDADLFFAQESSLMLENVALWVEAVVEDAAADVQIGFSDAVARHLSDLPVEELPANQRLALRRIQTRLGALRGLERDLNPQE